MVRPVTPMRRRSVMAAAAALLPLGPAAAAEANTLIVAGPVGSPLDHWAELLARRVGRGLPNRMPLVRQNIGGPDGVTGANQFEARGEPDGTTALLVPGAAALSWLVGEARAKFDPGRWIPLLATGGSAVLVSRVPLTAGVRLRIAGESPVGPELPVLLAADLLGIDGQLVGNSAPDAILLHGAGVSAAIATASVSGMVPVMTFGALTGAALPERDPLLPAVPTALELCSGCSRGALMAALRGTTLAVQLEAGLMLPPLTPAAAVAAWRSACGPLVTDADLTAQAARSELRVISAGAAADCHGRITGDAEMVLALRRWLSSRYGWRPA